MRRGDEIFLQLRGDLHRRTDRMFRWLLLAQWAVAIGLALAIAPYSYVKLAFALGGLINLLPIALIYARPGWWLTRHVIAFAQMMWSAVLIFVTGGRIETHFHAFGSLAFLAFYRDWRLLPMASIIVAGIDNPEWWRFLEHAAWVAFEDVVLVLACLHQTREMRASAEREAFLEETKANTEHEVERRTRELQESMDKYRSLVESTAAIPFEWDRLDRRMVYVAPQLATLLGCEYTELYEPGFVLARFHPADLVQLTSITDELVAGKRKPNLSIDVRMSTAAGQERYVRLIESGVTQHGRLIRGVMLDITLHKKLEAELAQAQKLESVGRLAAGVAHEINTPVQFVGDSIQFVRDSLDELFAALDRGAMAADDDLAYLVDQYPKALDRAIEGLQRVTTIVRSMKVFAHPDQRDMTPTDLNAALDSTLTVARNEYKYVADVDTHYDELPRVRCHAGEINQVILNVLINAAHAIADTGKRGKISIATRRDGDEHVVVSIGDTGTGIPEGVRHRVFDPFFTTKEVGRGTGQGLAIARAVIVDKYAGSLTFDTELGRGTVFHIRIPIEPQRSTA